MHMGDYSYDLYAFVDSISLPEEKDESGMRADIVFDAISRNVVDNEVGDLLSEENIFIIRVMTTINRIKQMFSVYELNEGSWFKIKLKKESNFPKAWILSASNSYSGAVDRVNLVSMERIDPGRSNGNYPSAYRLLSLYTPKIINANLKIKPPPSRSKGLKVRVIDVGQASFSAIHEEANGMPGKIVGYYDAGSPLFFHGKTFPKSFSEKSKVPSDGFVLLSHWDFDHYYLALTKLKELQSLKWYAPQQTVGPNAARLQRLLGANLSIICSSTYFISGDLCAWKGAGPADDRNGSGYALQVIQKDGNTLLTGDVSYDLIPAPAKADLKGICISHHGGKNGGVPPLPGHGSNRVAAVSFGIPNRYRHPNADVLDEHETKGWVVKPTAGSTPPRGDRWL